MNTKIESSSAGTSQSLTAGLTIVWAAQQALQQRRTRAEALGHKRRTTKHKYTEAWVNFAAFLRYRRSGEKPDLEHWATNGYRVVPDDTWLRQLEAELAAITHHDVQAYKVALLNLPSKRRGVGLAKSTIHLRLAALRHLFKIAIREEVIDRNPASTDYVDRLGQDGQVLKHVLTIDEVKKVLDVIPQNIIDVRNLQLFRLLAWTGMRRQEAAELYIGADFTTEPEGLLLDLTLKRGKESTILVPAGLEAELRHYVEALQLGHGPLFPRMRRLPCGTIMMGDRAVTPDTITAIIRRMTGEVLGTAYGPHRLRHFFANASYDGGASIEDIRQYLGHSSQRTTQRYLDLRPRRDRSAAELIDL